MIMLSFITAAPTPAAEQYAQSPSAASLRWENDTFGDTDANYTNGISLALTRPGNGPLGGVWGLLGEREGKRFATYELTQLQFTPVDLSRTNPDPADRPYAGLLYLGLTTHLQREESLQSLKLMAGLVGPGSLAEATQRFTHRTLGFGLPQGWASQIKNEPVIDLVYEYRRKFALTPRGAAAGIELIPRGGAMLGNYLIQGEAGAQLRVGYHLPDDFGATVLRGIGYLPFPLDEKPHHSWGFYAFAGGEASLVGWNVTLDGNTVAESRNVDKRPFLPAAEFGATLWTEYFQTSFAYVMLGKEFYGQKVREDYGSILLSAFF
jgi:lipid A 3-O-deacylase